MLTTFSTFRVNKVGLSLFVKGLGGAWLGVWAPWGRRKGHWLAVETLFILPLFWSWRQYGYRAGCVLLSGSP